MITAAALAVLALPFLVFGGLLALFLKRHRRSLLRWCVVLYFSLAFVFLFAVAPYLAAWMLSHAGTRPQDRLLRQTPADYGVRFEDVSFPSRDSIMLSGWLVAPSGRNAVVISCHGLFRNRVEVLDRTMALARAGYGTLLFDFRAHGMSGRGAVTLGNNERYDVLGAVDLVRRRYQDANPPPGIVLMGVSMGAVAVLEAEAEERSGEALVLDSPFSTIRETVIDHTRLFLSMPRYPFPQLFNFWFQRFTATDVARVDSHEALRRVGAVPVLFVASEGDARIGADVARELFRESTSSLRELELFGKDVPHGASSRLHPDEYNRTVAAFLTRALADTGR